jgi:hypothetical protein
MTVMLVMIAQSCSQRCCLISLHNPQTVCVSVRITLSFCHLCVSAVEQITFLSSQYRHQWSIDLLTRMQMSYDLSPYFPALKAMLHPHA